jgi:TonB family protein
METVVSQSNSADLHFLTEWGLEGDRARHRQAGLISFLVHVGAIAALLLMPRSWTEPVRAAIARQITPLVAPITEPTQTTPNQGPLSKEITAEALRPRPRIQIPPSPVSTTRPAARIPLPPSPPPAPAPSLAEPPKIEVAAPGLGMTPPGLTAQVTPPPPPQIQPQDKPKLSFENPDAGSGNAKGPGTGRLALPRNAVDEALHSMARGGAGGGLVVGDIGEPGVGGLGEGINMPPSPGRQASSLELLSDPGGVDFRPYLIKVLASVKRNWMAVMPESARLGRPGRVAIQFAIARNGSVPKLVIVSASGTDAFDRAAVAGVSASNPFPPLPTEYRGEQVKLQLNFAYNIVRR